jgi:Fe-S-cluster-containing dehydrogenase component
MPPMSDQQPGAALWRSLRELEGSADDGSKNERGTESGGTLEVNRREFWRLMGASAALAGLSGCTRQPTETIAPYVYAPEQVVPGKPMFYATTMTSGGAIGLLVESHEGHPTKIEGNPNHPASLGATDAFAQASILGLYDPDRSQAVLHLARPSNWLAFLSDLNTKLEELRAKKGAGMRLLTETVISPTLFSQLQAILAAFPEAKWHQFEPAARDEARAGSQIAFGRYVNTYYRFDRAAVILALDSEFLLYGPGSVRYARDFAAARRVEGTGYRNRLYVVESTPTSTGASADHRLAMRSSDMEGFLRAVAFAAGVTGAAAPPVYDAGFVNAVARDLAQHRGAGIVIAGDTQPPIVHALAHAMNDALGNVGNTVIHTDPIEPQPADQNQSIGELAAEMRAGAVGALFIIGGNPVYTAPADLNFGYELLSVPYRVHLSLYDDETSALCQWHIPEAHYLEAWSDARAFDGTASIAQPLIAPLYRGKSAHELLAAIAGRPDISGYELIREYWKSQLRSGDFEAAWRRALHDGVIAGTAFPSKQVALKGDLRFPGGQPSEASKGLEIVFRPDPAVWDGRFSNNAWLQELPKPITKITWDNAVLIGPALADRYGLQNEDVIEIRYRGRSLEAPVWVSPGHPGGSITVTLGYGRTRGGKLGAGAGFNAYSIRSWKEPWIGTGAEIRKTGRRRRLVSTEEHRTMEGRPIVRTATVSEYRRNPDFAHREEPEVPRDFTIYPNYEFAGYNWGMAIDLNACVGCNACAAACVAENNIAVVGKTEVARGREMYWLQVDRYYQGGWESPQIYFQPRLCMHCENAPCELVCPVEATVHSSDGLNQMVYNRCIGTRYCSNNCPYKVRHFNFFLYSDYSTPSLQFLRNPNVTVRSRGVIEKCTYCIQRISAAKILAEKEERRVHDGEIQTACQAACPTEAIIFGDMNDPESRVSKLKREPRNYSLLADLNTRPHTTYLAKLRNPNPELET